MSRTLPRLALAALAALSGMAGCARYTALPLATAPPLAADVRSLARAETIVGTEPLSVARVVDLVLANNPDLKAAQAGRDHREAA